MIKFIDRFIGLFFRRTANRGRDVQFIGNTVIGHDCSFSTRVIFSNSIIGDYSYVNYNSIIHCCHIGKFCSIGPNVVAGLGNHPVGKNVTTSPKLFLKGKFLLEDKYDQFAMVTIGNDVWIGANVTIVNGITIGDGAVIGANSIVTKDVPPYSIYGGVPAKYIRMRFEQNQIDFLLKLRWWDMDDDWIKNNSLLFSDINALMEKYEISI